MLTIAIPPTAVPVGQYTLRANVFTNLKSAQARTVDQTFVGLTDHNLTNPARPVKGFYYKFIINVLTIRPHRLNIKRVLNANQRDNNMKSAKQLLKCDICGLPHTSSSGPFCRRDGMLLCEDCDFEEDRKACMRPNGHHEPTAATPQPVVTVEKTGKRWKLGMLIGGGLAAVGFAMTIANFGREINDWPAVWLVGAAVWLVSKMGAWWHHG